MHYVDVGPADAPAVLLLHGQPTWSFLYRHVIAALAEQGHRVLAPDLVGFGRSDKPTDRTAYSQAAHIRWLRALVVALDVRDARWCARTGAARSGSAYWCANRPDSPALSRRTRSCTRRTRRSPAARRGRCTGSKAGVGLSSRRRCSTTSSRRSVTGSSR